MMILAGMALTWLIGAAMLFWLWALRFSVAAWRTILLWSVLAMTIGLGLVSLIDFGGLLLFNGAPWSWVVSLIVELAVGAGLMGVGIWNLKREAESESAEATGLEENDALIGAASIRGRGRSVLVGVTTLIGLIIGCIGAYFQVGAYGNYPHGDLDAWGIWNLRARFIFLGHENWHAGFSGALVWSHPDYPLLLPMNVARLWHVAGGDATLVPALLQALFWFAIPLLLYSAVSRMRGHFSGMAAVLCLSANSAYWIQGETQIADLPLAMYMLGSLVALVECLGAKGRARLGLAAVSGALAGCAAWTKNEGLPFSLVVGGVFAVATVRKRSDLRVILAWVFAAIPFLVANLLVKRLAENPNDLLEGQSAGRALGLIVNLDRHAMIWRSVGGRMSEFPEWLITLFVVVVAWFLLGGFRNTLTQKKLLVPLVCVVVMSAVYYLVYVLTPKDLLWQLGTTIDRLVLHLWPAFLFCLFVGMDGMWVGKAKGLGENRP